MIPIMCPMIGILDLIGGGSLGSNVGPTNHEKERKKTVTAIATIVTSVGPDAICGVSIMTVNSLGR